jgi:cation diffusion facilitator family transporter
MTPAPRYAGLEEAARPVRRVALLSLATALLLTVAKLVGWRLSGSVGLLASLADSGLDMLAAAGTLLAIRLAATPPDAEHRFGHGKAEAFASLLQAALIFASAALIAREAVLRLIAPEPVRTEGLATAIMVVSTLLACLLVYLQGRVLSQARSVAVEGDRLHYLADVGANLVTLVGLALTALLHAPRIDAVAGLMVAMGLVLGGVGMLKGAADNLMDRELDDEERSAIVELASQDPQIHLVHDLRTRAAGPLVHIQLHADMDPHLTLEEAHRILIRAERRILERFPAADILIHPNPHGRDEPHGGAFAQAIAGLTAQERVTERVTDGQVTDGQPKAREGA